MYKSSCCRHEPVSSLAARRRAAAPAKAEGEEG